MMGEWRKYNLLELADIYNEKRKPLSKMQRLKLQGKYPYYGASGIVDYIDDYTFDGEFILISEDGENLKTRKTPIAFKASGKFWVNNHAHIIKGKTSYLNDLLIYFFSNLDLNPYLTGAVQPKLSKGTLLNIPIYLPKNESEQKAIAEVLSSLDDKIDLLHRQNKTLEEMAQTLFRQWFIENGFDGNIGDIIDLQSGYAFKSKNFTDSGTDRVIKIKNISNSTIDIVNTDFIDIEIAKNINKKFKITSGDILFGMTGANIGKMGIVPKNNLNLWLNQRVGLLREKYKNSKYLAYLHLTSEYGFDYIENTASGSAQPNISATDIEKCPFPKLTPDEVQKYSNQVASYFEKIVFNLGQIQILENMRDILLPKLISGEVRIKR